MSGNCCGKIFYRITSNDLVGVDGRTGEIYVQESWKGATGTVVVEIVATGQLSRNPRFKSNMLAAENFQENHLDNRLSLLMNRLVFVSLIEWNHFFMKQFIAVARYISSEGM